MVIKDDDDDDDDDGNDDDNDDDDNIMKYMVHRALYAISSTVLSLFFC